jgi:hypothetical protein
MNARLKAGQRYARTREHQVAIRRAWRECALRGGRQPEVERRNASTAELRNRRQRVRSAAMIYDVNGSANPDFQV